MPKDNPKWDKIPEHLRQIGERYNEDNPMTPREKEMLIQREQISGLQKYKLYISILAVLERWFGKKEQDS